MLLQIVQRRFLLLLLAQVLRQEWVHRKVGLVDTGVGHLGLTNNRVFLQLVRVLVDDLFAHDGRNSVFLTTLLGDLVEVILSESLVHQVGSLVPNALPRHVFLVVA